ncbi:MAG: helix-turn-helix domain-containing protein [Gordonia sp. (in: high G+C Gram-positive bacteria)]
MDADWPLVSPRTRELIRRGCRIILDPPAAWVDALNSAALGGVRMRAVGEDDVLAEGIRRTNMANTMRWAICNAAHPGEPVAAELTPEIVAATSDLVRRGLDEASLDAFRTAQNVAWQLWMEICFGLTDNPAELRELLAVTSLSIARFIDDTVAAMSERMRTERADLSDGAHVRRRETVTLVLEGAPIPLARAQAQLGYRLSGPQLAMVLWSTTPAAAAHLEAAAATLARAAGAADRLTIAAATSTWWMWLPVASIGAPDLSGQPGIRVSVGRPGEGIDGFRSSHLEAVSTQRMHVRVGVDRLLVAFDDIRLAALLGGNAAAADDFVADTLGALAHADTHLLNTVRMWISLRCNTSQTAEALYTHRNTIIRRLARAEELLPRPLDECFLHVGVALDLLRW